jgi:hypothetical protein
VEVPPHVAPSYFFPLVSAVEIDADLREWAEFPASVLDVDTADWVHPREVPDPRDASARLRSGWDHNFLYFSVEVEDDILVADGDGTEIWRDDSIELGIDGLQDHIGWQEDDHQFTLSLNGLVTDYALPTEAVTAVTRTLRGGWVLEMAIAVEGLGVGALSAGQALGFTFGLHDDDDGGDWESYLIWKGDSTNSVAPDYGTLLLQAPALHPALLGGVVWSDADSDGHRDAVEVGIGGAEVRLYDEAGALLAVSVTDGQGSYRFDKLGIGTYTVAAEPLPRHAYVPTTSRLLLRHLAPDEQDEAANFGFLPLTAVSLLTFGAEVTPGGVEISWSTQREGWIATWSVERSPSESGPWVEVSESPVPARGMGGVGGVYRILDGDVQSGSIYYYRLVALPLGRGFGPLVVDLTV